ncbi:hypothetical protein [Devosia nitrariae]|uniref:DUF2214 domain-containing protein n=1 Tax=Devosia nitrariae TaxID=2071872 RepID=A0ABQ5W1D7_9HYPH|nr:hypothetical protein [Devosia nitrariae]GLQ53730.1 hypothetical protein GCM10010862_09890 [Devosia nitrariae]
MTAEGVLAALEATGFARVLRTSFYLYPVVNAAHILALGMLITAALFMDARIFGLARHLPAATVIGTLRPVAIGALVVAAVTGFLLFSVRPFDYVANPAFAIKLVLLILAVVNAGAATALGDRDLERPLVRVVAAASIALWLAALLAGRFIGFLA